MPVIPAFNEYAPAPNLAQSYLAQQRLQQEAAANAARIQLGYAELQQRAVENEMQLAAQKETLARENLRKAQEAEVEKAYREAQLGIAERGLKQQAEINQMKLDEAARAFSEQQIWNREFPTLEQEGLKSGLSPMEARVNAARTLTLRRGGTGVATAIQEPSNVGRLGLENRIIQQQKEDLLRPYTMGGVQLPVPPEVQSKIDALSKRQTGLLTPSTATGTNAPAGASATKRLRWNPKTGEFE